MRFYPSNIYLFKHNLLKLTSFGNSQQINSSSSSYEGSIQLDSHF